jgi:AraC family transcriptional regulator of adaptative response/methylated-DNA-[protein]-cysteine methyltransferase
MITSTSTSTADLAKAGAADVLIPVIRAAATIGFVIAPYSLGFVIIAVSEQLIRSIMVGEHPEMLVSELQNQFPNALVEVTESYDAELVAKVVELLERPDQTLDLSLDIRGTDFQSRVWDALQKTPAGNAVNYTFLAEQIGAQSEVRLQATRGPF